MAPMLLEVHPFKRAQFDLVVSPGIHEHQDIRCIPDLIRFNAKHNPDRTFCVQAGLRPDQQTFNYRYISFLELNRAVDRCCNWILSNVEDVHPATCAKDGSVRKCRPVALFMESDVGLFIYIAALLTLNIPVYLFSPH